MASFDSIRMSELADVAAGSHPIDHLVIGSGTGGVTAAPLVGQAEALLAGKGAS